MLNDINGFYDIYFNLIIVECKHGEENMHNFPYWKSWRKRKFSLGSLFNFAHNCKMSNVAAKFSTHGLSWQDDILKFKRKSGGMR